MRWFLLFAGPLEPVTATGKTPACAPMSHCCENARYDKDNYRTAKGLWADDPGWWNKTHSSAKKKKGSAMVASRMFEVPHVASSKALLTLLVNFFLPGIGTIVLGSVIDQRDIVIMGVLQFLLTFAFGLGWIWAVAWSCLLVYKALAMRNGNYGRHENREERARMRRKQKFNEERARKAADKVKKPAKAAVGKKKGGKKKAGRKKAVAKKRHAGHAHGHDAWKARAGDSHAIRHNERRH